MNPNRCQTAVFLLLFAAALLIPAAGSAAPARSDEPVQPAAAVNIALGKSVRITTNGANDANRGAGVDPSDITDGSLAYAPASNLTEDGVVGYVNNDHNQMMQIDITIDLQQAYHITKIRYNMGNVQRAETWNPDWMITAFAESATQAGSPYKGAWTEHNGDMTASSVTISLRKTRTSYETDWLFIGEIEVYGTLVHADFTASVTKGVQPLVVQFTDQSTGPINAWRWDFGDGTSSTARNPTHEFHTSGDVTHSYNVSLTVSGGGSSDTKTRYGYIQVYRGDPGPRVVAVEPTDGATAVPIEPMPLIVAYFDVDMYVNWFTPDFIRLRRCGGDDLEVQVFALSYRKVGVWPVEKLAPAACYQVILSGSLKSKDGRPMITSHVWSFSTESAAVDLMPVRIEINQGTGDPSRLLRGRNTTIRIYIKNLEQKAQVTTDVLLSVVPIADDQTDQTDQAVQAVQSSATWRTTFTVKKVYTNTDRAYGSDAATVYIDADRINSLFAPGGRYLFQAIVDPDDKLQETNVANNQVDASLASFQDGKPAKVMIAVITVNGRNGPDAAPALDFARDLYAVQQSPSQAGLDLTWVHLDRPEPFWRIEPQFSRLIGELRAMADSKDIDYVIGLTGGAGDAYGDGVAYPNKVAMIKTQSRYPYHTQTLVAHEFGHLIGLPDQYYYRDSQIQCSTFAGRTAHDYNLQLSGLFRVNTDSLGIHRYNIMCAFAPLEHLERGVSAREVYWLAETDYETALQTLQGNSAARANAEAAGPVFLLSGAVQKTGAGTLDSVFQLPAGEVAAGVDGEYAVEIQDANGAVLASHHFQPDFHVAASPPYESDSAGWSAHLAVHPNASRIVLRRGDEILSQRTASLHAPEVTLLSPTGGEYLEGIREIRWQAADLDGADSLRYALFYSPDGAEWLPVAHNLTATVYPWNTTQWPGASTGKIMVLVSDGFHTSSDESDGSFRIGSKAPGVYINGSDVLRSYLDGEQIVLDGFGLDLEDGFLPESALTWTDSNANILGTGSALTVKELPAGTNIFLTGRDSDGNTSKAVAPIQFRADGDHDGMWDSWESRNSLNPEINDGYYDYDFDYLTNVEEYRLNTAPRSADSDGDKLLDGDEVRLGSNPLDKNSAAWHYLHLPYVCAR